mmetsp:Transcript_89768/g.205198  ORF Transcript_89768/g.205198 Transcript_89768/m.205198 type:complete len:404 (-) Transcript_89768:362-1573(-)
MQHAAGPAAKVMYLLAIVHTGAMYYFFTTAFEGSYCSRGSKYGIASYSDEVLPEVFLLWLVTACGEVWVLRYTILPFYQGVRQFNAMGIKNRAFLWVILGVLSTGVNVLDHATDSFFFAQVWFTQSHCKESKLACFWRVSMAQSTFFSSLQGFPFSALAAFFFAASLLHIVWPLVDCFPCPWHLWKVLTARVHPGGQRLAFTTVLGGEYTYGDPVHTVAEGIGMATETWQGVRFPLEKARPLLEENPPMAKRAQPLLIAATQRVLMRSFFNLLRSGLQVQLQVTLLAVARGGAYASNVEPTGELQVGAKILLSVLTGLLNMGQNAQYSLFCVGEAYKMYTKLNEADSTFAKGLFWRFFWTNVCIVLNFWLLSHAVMKFWYAFHCDYAMWDLGSGCVNETVCFD